MIVPVLATTFMAIPPAHATTATGTIAGTITDNGAPVADASIYVSDEDWNFSGYASTDENGRYEIADVPAATSAYRVSIDAPGHPWQYAYGKTDWEDANVFSVTAGQQTTVNDSLLPTGTITGRFTNAAGNGVSAWVGASGDGTPFSSAGTDVDGNYSFSVLPGTYRVTFYFGSTQQYAYGTPDWDQAALFTVAAGQTVTVNDVQLVTGTITGRVTNADGTPARNVQVRASSGNSHGYGTTNRSGVYRIDDLLPGSYRLVYELPSGARQWAHQARSFEDAQPVTVSGDTVTTVDEQLLPTGSVAGRFTDNNGAGIANVSVSLSGSDEEESISGETEADGTYRIDGIFTGSYRVRFYDWESHLNQYAYGKTTADAADPITIAAGQTSTVNDSRLPTGSIRFTAKDSLTGAAISSFHADLGDRGGHTEDGSFVLTDVAIGTYPVSAGADGYAYAENAATVTVNAGQQSEVQLTLRPVGKITTKVVDRASGIPVAGICVFAVQPNRFTFPDGCGSRTDATGAVTVEVQDPGSYRLFVLPDRGNPYGAQWVGLAGGTGSQLTARPVAVAAGRTTSVPKIKLDKRGTITGKVTSETGGPLQYGTVGIVGPDLGAGADKRYSPIAADGTYTIDWLGPYRWPLLFHADDHAFQWSGGVGNRLLARTVPVQSGKATRFDYVLKQGTNLTVTIPGETNWPRVVILNAVTGDPMGVVDIRPPSPAAEVRIIGPQAVKVLCYCSSTRWYGGTDFASATPVMIPATGTPKITFPTR